MPFAATWMVLEIIILSEVSVSKSEVAQSHPTLCDPMDCSPPGSSVHGILQARILEWVAISSSRGSSQPRDGTWVSCTAGRHPLRHQGSLVKWVKWRKQAKQTSYDITYVWKLKKRWHKWTYLQNRNRLTDFKSKLMVPKGEMFGGDKLGTWD